MFGTKSNAHSLFLAINQSDVEIQNDFLNYKLKIHLCPLRIFDRSTKLLQIIAVRCFDNLLDNVFARNSANAYEKQTLTLVFSDNMASTDLKKPRGSTPEDLYPFKCAGPGKIYFMIDRHFPRKHNSPLHATDFVPEKAKANTTLPGAVAGIFRTKYDMGMS